MAKGRVAGYIRVSKEREGMEAPDIYEAQIRDWCKRNGYAPPELFMDLDYSGRRGSKTRPDFTRMLAKQREFDVIVVPRLDRLGRSLIDALPVLEQLNKNGIDFVALDVPGLDTTTPTGRLMLHSLISLAEYQSDQISETWKNTIDHLRRNGRANGGKSTPYGYRYQKKTETSREKISKHPGEAKNVREIFRRYLKGQSISRIARELGIYTNTVRRILENPAYIGRMRHGEEVLPGPWPPLVKEADWNAVQALRAEQKQKALPPRTGKGQYLLSGLLHCGVCGSVTHHHKGWAGGPESKYPGHYACGYKGNRKGDRCAGGTVSAPRAEAMIEERFLDMLSGPFAKRARKAPKSWFSPSTSMAEKDLEEELQRLRKRMTGYVDQLAEAGRGQTGSIKQRIAQLEEELAEVEKKLVEREAAGVKQARKIEDIDELRARLAKLPDVWRRLPVEDRRDALALCIDRIDMIPGSRPKDLRIVWADWVTDLSATA